MSESEKQKAREALGDLKTRADVASLVGMTVHQLHYYLFGLTSERRYARLSLRKRSGGVREIRSPIAPLKAAQRIVAEHLSAFYEPRGNVYGYVDGRSIIGNAACHSPKRWVLRVDLQDFFPSINFGRVRGLLMAGPFGLPDQVATTLAQLCVDENQLPQGSPASPIISNIVCRGLDRALADIARTYRCTFTRYCDDLVFSTNRATFPPALARLEDGSEGTVSVALGEILRKAITEAGFQVNDQKTQLKPKSQRQLVTGLITNTRVNVPRKFILEVRSLLHAWKRIGDANAAGKWYFEKHDKRNRPPGKLAPRFELVVRGKVQHVGAVRGWDDPIYRRFARQLETLDASFKPHPYPIVQAKIELHVYTEGKTDRMHMQAALRALKSAGKYPQLELVFSDGKGGSSDLAKFCEHTALRKQTAPCVFVFDSDERDITKRVLDSAGRPKDWGNEVFSLVLPTPEHRKPADRTCIELLYTDIDFARRDTEGRRLFQRQEFNTSSGRHSSERVHCANIVRNTLVIDDGVFDFDTGVKVSLSKFAFASLIATLPVGQVDFAGFEAFFDELEKLRQRIAALRASAAE